MRFVTTITFAVTGSLLVALTVAKPIPNWKAGGMAIPLTRHPSSESFLHSNTSIDLDAISSHGVSVREKILRGLDNYEINTGTKHPFAVKQTRSESGLLKRDASLPLTNFENDMWKCEISIGTPPETLNVHIDTGAADMWVVQTGCNGVPADINFWDPRLSSSKNRGRPFQIPYADGSGVKGRLYTDNVTIAGFTADLQTFGSATSYIQAPNRLKQDHADGLLGLAFSTISTFGTDPLFRSLARQNVLTDPTFSLKLSSSGAEMYVGGANSKLYHGDITYTPVTEPGLWQVSMDDVRVNGHKVLETVPVILDTGATYIYGDWERVAEFYRPLGGILEEHGNFGYYTLPCSSFPTVSLTFGGRTFEIPSEHLKRNSMKEGSPNCFSAIVAFHEPKFEFWTIGMPFLQGVYSVFDYNNLRVGFADLA